VLETFIISFWGLKQIVCSFYSIKSLFKSLLNLNRSDCHYQWWLCSKTYYDHFVRQNLLQSYHSAPNPAVVIFNRKKEITENTDNPGFFVHWWATLKSTKYRKQFTHPWNTKILTVFRDFPQVSFLVLSWFWK